VHRLWCRNDLRRELLRAVTVNRCPRPHCGGSLLLEVEKHQLLRRPVEVYTCLSCGRRLEVVHDAPQGATQVTLSVSPQPVPRRRGAGRPKGLPQPINMPEGFVTLRSLAASKQQVALLVKRAIRKKIELRRGERRTWLVKAEDAERVVTRP